MICGVKIQSFLAILSIFCRCFVLLGRLITCEAVVESEVAIFHARVLRERALNDDKLGLLAQLVQEAHLALRLLERFTLRRVQCYLTLTLVYGHWEKIRAKLCHSLLFCIRRLGPRGLVQIVYLDAAS